MTAPRDPRGRRQWQVAVDAAHALLVIDSARQYGLVEGGPEVNVERCEELLRRGADRGIVPRQDAIETFLRELVRAVE